MLPNKALHRDAQRTKINCKYFNVKLGDQYLLFESWKCLVLETSQTTACEFEKLQGTKDNHRSTYLVDGAVIGKAYV